MHAFEHQIAHCMDPVSELLERTTNPHHQAILRNFRRHVHLELAARFEDIVAPDMMVDEPVYRINWGRPLTLRGKAAVIEFYRSAGRFVMWNSDDKIAVAN